MSRDSFLATEIMQWKYRILAYWRPDIDDDGNAYDEYIMLQTDWNPGEDWHQIGMILKAMERDYQVKITQQMSFFNPLEYHVVFVGMNETGEATEVELREAVATAAARTKGWEDGMG